ncbi:STAS domain-containing protein [Rhodococcus triatomae]|nr:anti sigma factor antagonist [Rhodococcus triatomae BKS 15-14]
MRIDVHRLDQPLIESGTSPSRRRIAGARGPTVASVSGDLDITVLPAFEQAIERAIRDATGRTLIVDLSRLDFLAICGVQALAEAQDDACRHGLAMLLVPPPPPSHRALTATGMTGHFDTHPSVRAAVDARRTALTAHLDIHETVTRSCNN